MKQRWHVGYIADLVCFTVVVIVSLSERLSNAFFQLLRLIGSCLQIQEGYTLCNSLSWSQQVLNTKPILHWRQTARWFKVAQVTLVSRYCIYINTQPQKLARGSKGLWEGEVKLAVIYQLQQQQWLRHQCINKLQAHTHTLKPSCTMVLMRYNGKRSLLRVGSRCTMRWMLNSQLHTISPLMIPSCFYCTIKSSRVSAMNGVFWQEIKKTQSRKQQGRKPAKLLQKTGLEAEGIFIHPANIDFFSLLLSPSMLQTYPTPDPQPPPPLMPLSDTGLAESWVVL